MVMALVLAFGTILPAGAATMERYRWKNRVLVLFAPGDVPELAAQRDHLLRYEPHLAERAIVIFAVIGNDRIQAIHGDAPPADQVPGLRSEFRVAPDAPFTALLVGLDGGVKWRENRPAEQAELFGLIDSMPMRRNKS
jgi:hypothetical protein